MVDARVGHVAVLLPSGEVLVAGGSNVRAAELYEPVTRTFRPSGTMASSNPEQALLLNNGKVLLLGPDTAELYDPATRTFSLTSGMLTFSAIIDLLLIGRACT